MSRRLRYWMLILTAPLLIGGLVVIEALAMLGRLGDAASRAAPSRPSAWGSLPPQPGIPPGRLSA